MIVYLSHKTICSGSFFVFENDVGIVIGDELLESRVFAADFAFRQSTGA